MLLPGVAKMKIHHVGHEKYLHIHSLGYEHLICECSFYIKNPLKVHSKMTPGEQDYFQRYLILSRPSWPGAVMEIIGRYSPGIQSGDVEHSR